MPKMLLHIRLFATMFFGFASFSAFAEEPIFIKDIIQVQETCELANGELTINIEGDATGLRFSVDNGATFQDSNHFTGLKSGDYLIIVTDGGDCTLKKTAQIADAPEPTLTLSGECITGLNRVALYPDVQGGIMPYTYSWEGPNNSTYTDDLLTQVLPGTYNLTITDALGCTFSDSVTIDLCCELIHACSMSGSTTYCENTIPAIPTIFNSSLSKEDKIKELSAIGIDIETGSCGDLTVVISDTTNDPTSCAQDTLIVIREYAISDNHKTFTCTQEFFVLDFVKTSLISPAVDGESQCQNDIQAEFQAWLANNGDMAYEACSDPISIRTEPANPVMEEFCGANTSVNFIVEDGCGNTIRSSASYSIIDIENPVIICPDNLVIDPSDPDLDSILDDWIASAVRSDNCGIADVTTSLDRTAIILDCASQPSLPVTFIVEDNCGLTAQCSTALTNASPPEIVCPDVLTIHCSETDIDMTVEAWSKTASASNNGSNPILVDLPTISQLSFQNCKEEIPVLYSVTNDCNLESTCNTSIVMIDEEDPIMNCASPITITINEEDFIQEIETWLKSTTATDCNTTEIKNDFIMDYSDEICQEVMPVTFTAKDICDNESSCTSMLTLVNVTEINLTCPEPITVLCSSPELQEILNSLIDQAEVSATHSYVQSILYDQEALSGGCELVSLIDINIVAEDKCGKLAECYTSINLISEPEIYIPNVFSPDRDGLNDYFTAYSNSSVDYIKSMLIYNKWGNKIFETSDIPTNEDRLGWDGTYHEKMEGNNVYTYFFVIVDIFGNEIEKVGTVQVLKR